MSGGQDIKTVLKSGLRPRRSLASEPFYVALFSLLALTPAAGLLLAGANGWTYRGGTLALVPLAVSALAAVLLARSLARSMAPGSAPDRPATWMLGWLAATVAALAFSTTPDRPNWGAGETHCFESGLAIGLVLAVPAMLLLRRGFVLRWGPALTVAGGLAGLSGLLALEVSCPNAGLWHVMVSHLPVPAAMAAGAAAAYGLVSLARRHRLP